MPVAIRLSRKGTKKKPFYHVIAVDKTRRRDGVYLEKLGSYEPKAEKPADKVKFDAEKIQAWVDRGAQLSQTVGQLLKIQSK